MAYNGSGTFERLYDWTDDKTNGIKILASRMDAEMDGMATGLSTAITKDGQTTITADLPMSGYKHTNVDDATARDQYAVVGQVQDGDYTWVDGGGTADAITAAYDPVITALVDGMQLGVRATAANATTTPTFSPNGLTARTIVKEGGTALVAGDIAGDGHELLLRYDLTNTRWELLNPANPGHLDNVVADTAPQLGGDLDANGNDIQFDNSTGIRDDSGNEQLIFGKTASAVNHVKMTNNATGSGPTIAAVGDDTNIDLNINAKGTGKVVIDDATISSLAYPTSDGSANQVLKTDGSGTLSFGGAGYLETAVATTSGTAIDFTSIPSWAKKITLMLSNVSTNGTDALRVQIGDSGGVETTGYEGARAALSDGSAVGVSNFSAGFDITVPEASSGSHGVVILTLLDSSTNTWAMSSGIGEDARTVFRSAAGSKSLSATLDRIRLTTSGGTNTFDAGKVNILIE